MLDANLINLDVIRQSPLLRLSPTITFWVRVPCTQTLWVPDMRKDFPAIDKAGYLTVEEVLLKGRFKALIDELEGPELTEALSQKFGRNLHPHPRLTTIMRKSQTKYGAIHTDGAAKVMTMLVYMNDNWNPGEGGRCACSTMASTTSPMPPRSPNMGNVFAFLRSDKSWHGHRPFAGERKVIQIAWVKDQAELDRKKKRNSTAQFLKGVFGGKMSVVSEMQNAPAGGRGVRSGE